MIRRSSYFDSGLFSYALKPVMRPIRRWYFLKRAEWAMQAADVEKGKVKQAQADEATFHARAAHYRSKAHRV